MRAAIPCATAFSWIVSVPQLEQLKTLMGQDARVLLAAPNQGEVERLANLLRECEVPYRLGSRPVP